MRSTNFRPEAASSSLIVYSSEAFSLKAKRKILPLLLQYIPTEILH